MQFHHGLDVDCDAMILVVKRWRLYGVQDAECAQKQNSRCICKGSFPRRLVEQERNICAKSCHEIMKQCEVQSDSFESPPDPKSWRLCSISRDGAAAQTRLDSGRKWIWSRRIFVLRRITLLPAKPSKADGDDLVVKFTICLPMLTEVNFLAPLVQNGCGAAQEQAHHQQDETGHLLLALTLTFWKSNQWSQCLQASLVEWQFLEFTFEFWWGGVLNTDLSR